MLNLLNDLNWVIKWLSRFTKHPLNGGLKRKEKSIIIYVTAGETNDKVKIHVSWLKQTASTWETSFGKV